MSPFVGIALSLLPELAKRLARPGKSDAQTAIVAAVQEVLETTDPAEAESKARTPDIANALRIRLARIENDAAAAEAAERELARRAELENLRLEIARAANARDDSADARAMLNGLAKERNVIAWGPVVVSGVVVVGFFATLLYLINGGLASDRFLPSDPGSQLVFQIVNITVGTLTAGFATVISFWLGSSDGSRRKDLSLAEVQKAQSEVQRETARQTGEFLRDHTRTAGVIVEQIRNKPAAPAPRPDSRFDHCLAFVLKHEGGYVDHPDDPGGATNLGITHRTLADWRGAPVTREDVRALEREEAREIYRARYWNALNCDQLPAGVDLVVFDFGVNAGPSRAARLLQRIVGAEQDGQIGPKTLASTSGVPADEIVAGFSDARLNYYRSLKHWSSFGRGWTSRTEDIRAAALAMQTLRDAA